MCQVYLCIADVQIKTKGPSECVILYFFHDGLFVYRTIDDFVVDEW